MMYFLGWQTDARSLLEIRDFPIVYVFSHFLKMNHEDREDHKEIRGLRHYLDRGLCEGLRGSSFIGSLNTSCRSHHGSAFYEFINPARHSRPRKHVNSIDRLPPVSGVGVEGLVQNAKDC